MSTVSGVAHVGGKAFPVTASITLPAASSVGPIMGCSNSDEDHGGITNWLAWRVYALGDVQGRLGFGAKRIALSADRASGGTYGVINVAGGQSAANALKAFFIDFYGQVGSPTKNAGVFIDYLDGNEQDRNAPSAAYFTTYDLLKAVTDQFANVRIGYDCTHGNVTSGVTQRNYGALAGKVEVLYASLYPPGRSKTPIVFDPYSKYVDDVLDLAVAWSVKHFAIGETGIPVATADSHGVIDYTIRAAYFCGGTTAGSALYPSTTYIGLNQYVANACAARGISFDVSLYWDQDIGLANPFWHDENTATPLAPRWHGWTPA